MRYWSQVTGKRNQNVSVYSYVILIIHGPNVYLWAPLYLHRIFMSWAHIWAKHVFMFMGIVYSCLGPFMGSAYIYVLGPLSGPTSGPNAHVFMLMGPHTFTGSREFSLSWQPRFTLPTALEPSSALWTRAFQNIQFIAKVTCTCSPPGTVITRCCR